MNHVEYADYEARFAAFMEREGLSNLSTVSDDDGNTEPSFSWNPCHCCQRRFGGDRYDCNGYNPTTEEVQDGYRVCTDCVYYAEYGQLDDMTMLDVEKSREEAAKSEAERYADEVLDQLD
jgi:hypothetical protein